MGQRDVPAGSGRVDRAPQQVAGQRGAVLGARLVEGAAVDQGAVGSVDEEVRVQAAPKARAAD